MNEITNLEKKMVFGLNGQKMERKHSKVISKTATNNSFYGRGTLNGICPIIAFSTA